MRIHYNDHRRQPVSFLVMQRKAGSQTESEAAAVNENTVTLTEQQMKMRRILTGHPWWKKHERNHQGQWPWWTPPQNMVSIGFPTGGYL